MGSGKIERKGEREGGSTSTILAPIQVNPEHFVYLSYKFSVGPRFVEP